MQLRTALSAVDLDHVGVGLTDVNTLVTAPRGVELERVGGGTSWMRRRRQRRSQKLGRSFTPVFPRIMLEVVPGSEDLPILLAMTELPLADARNRLSELVADVEQTQERVMITKHGHPAAVLISPDDLASLEETLDVLSDPDALADIREAEAEADRGEYTSAAQMQLLLEERRRRDSGAA